METVAARDRPAVVVTGVATGIGNGTLRELIRAGYRVFGSVRKDADADRLSKEFGDAYTPLIFDVTDAVGVLKGAEAARKALNGALLSGVVNNAGIGVGGPLLELPVSEFRRQLEANLVSVLTVTQAFFPLLRKAGDGIGKSSRIINISSVAGQLALPFLGPYAASKHGLEGLSGSLRRECMLYGVDVVMIGPASIATPAWDKIGEEDHSRYANSPYREAMKRLEESMVMTGRHGSPPEVVGRLVVKTLSVRKPRPRYMVGKGSTRIWAMTHLVPPRVVDRLIARSLGLTPRVG